MDTLTAHNRLDLSQTVGDLGLEPAIEVGGHRQSPLDRRRVSIRWFGGTILTAFAGAALIGAAIYAALDWQSNFAEAPVPALITHKEAETGINPSKGDRLVKTIDIVADKQTFKEPTTIKVGDKEVVRVHSFTHVATTLVTTEAGFADEVPPYDPLKLLADARSPVNEPVITDQGDADVAFSVHDLPTDKLSQTAVLSLPEVEAQVDEAVKSEQTAGGEQLSLPPQLLLMRTSRAEALDALPYANPNDPLSSSPFSQIQVRMVPENVTVVPRASSLQQPTEMEERLIVIRHGQTLEEALRGAGIDEATIVAVANAFAPKPGTPTVPEGRRLKLLLADLDGSGKTLTLARLSVYNDETLESTVAITDRGDYVRVTDNDDEEADEKPAANNNGDDEEGGMRLYDSLYETALKQNIPKPIIDDLVRIFANDVDFQRPVTGGDSFEAFYDNGEEGEHRNELLYASIVARNETFRYYRFQTPDDGQVDFYDPHGKSSRKFLIRTPIVGARMTSPYGMRFHPILGYTRLHSGVDWAAPIGTPIFSAGNGVIVSAGWDSGYGRRVVIQHANGYMTTYNHMSGFARGIADGARVHQGQVIGYLGESGLATGPHLHYEVLINGHFVDPMRVRLAQTREFDGKMLTLFSRERDRIDTLIAKAPNGATFAAREDR
ncbi:M23 family metallopeptidase [uncultured Methylovirgula sp.]|uniref:M23 family metallopeptidase n=1 Tax=uncultured Methylovirgula sp. TaxID=1285960 RepID=UPI002627C8AE|nr:M23 family metallopeptidase [uncultured Methylovirgula sp.]